MSRQVVSADGLRDLARSSNDARSHISGVAAELAGRIGGVDRSGWAAGGMDGAWSDARGRLHSVDNRLDGMRLKLESRSRLAEQLNTRPSGGVLDRIREGARRLLSEAVSALANTLNKDASAGRQGWLTHLINSVASVVLGGKSQGPSVLGASGIDLWNSGLLVSLLGIAGGLAPWRSIQTLDGAVFGHAAGRGLSLDGLHIDATSASLRPATAQPSLFEALLSRMFRWIGNGHSRGTLTETAPVKIDPPKPPKKPVQPGEVLTQTDPRGNPNEPDVLSVRRLELRDAKPERVEWDQTKEIVSIRDHIIYYGCLMTVYTMLLRDKGEDVYVTDLYKANYDLVNGSGTFAKDSATGTVVIWSLQAQGGLISKVAPGFQLEPARLTGADSAAVQAALAQALAEHGSVALHVNSGSSSGHWIVVDGRNDDGTFNIRDPNPMEGRPASARVTIGTDSGDYVFADLREINFVQEQSGND